MFGFIKRKCTAETLGTIVKKRWNGNLWFITVEYFVEGQSYIVKEQLTYHVEKKYKVGKVPVGMHSTSALKSIDINASVRVNPKSNFRLLTRKLASLQISANLFITSRPLAVLAFSLPLNLRLTFTTRSALKGDRKIALTDKEFDILQFFMEHKGVG